MYNRKYLKKYILPIKLIYKYKKQYIELYSLFLNTITVPTIDVTREGIGWALTLPQNFLSPYTFENIGTCLTLNT